MKTQETAQADQAGARSPWGCVQKFVSPFGRSKTGDWKRRQMISTALEDIKNAATEAEECLTRDDEGGYKIEQAISALDDLAAAWTRLQEANDLAQPTPVTTNNTAQNEH